MSGDREIQRQTQEAVEQAKQGNWSAVYRILEEERRQDPEGCTTSARERMLTEALITAKILPPGVEIVGLDKEHKIVLKIKRESSQLDPQRKLGAASRELEGKGILPKQFKIECSYSGQPKTIDEQINDLRAVLTPEKFAAGKPGTWNTDGQPGLSRKDLLQAVSRVSPGSREHWAIWYLLGNWEEFTKPGAKAILLDDIERFAKKVELSVQRRQSDQAKTIDQQMKDLRDVMTPEKFAAAKPGTWNTDGQPGLSRKDLLRATSRVPKGSREYDVIWLLLSAFDDIVKPGARAILPEDIQRFAHRQMSVHTPPSLPLGKLARPH